MSQLDSLPQGIKSLVKTIGEYWVRFPEAKSVPEDDLMVFYNSLYPKSKDREFVEQVLTGMKEIKIENPEVLTGALNTVVYHHFMASITGLAIKGSGEYDPSIPEAIAGKLEDYKMMAGAAKDPEARVFKVDLKRIRAAEKSLNLKWRLRFINECLGNPRPGRLHHVFGLSHAGKSIMLISEATNFARQLEAAKQDECILYYSNEEGGQQLIDRMIASLTGQDIELVRRYDDRAQAAWDNYGGKKIKIIDDGAHIAQIKRDIHTFRPLFVFIDQGTKVAVSLSKSAARHEALQQIYYEYRKLVVKYQNCIMTSGQADNASVGKKWLSLQNMDGSKVGMPGELDVALAIGCGDEREGMELMRYLYFPKNRYNGKCLKDTVVMQSEKTRFV